jgi:hypothetical protein
MVALKNDPLWTRLGPFQLPYPPFDYNSGMGVQDVDRDQAVALGLIDEDTQIEPQDRGFAADLQSEVQVDADRQAALLQAIQEAMGDQVSIEGGVLRFRAAPSGVMEQDLADIVGEPRQGRD